MRDETKVMDVYIRLRSDNGFAEYDTYNFDSNLKQLMSNQGDYHSQSFAKD